jgi:3-vinyl bacteriochlorophyllide hydratase
MSRWTLVQGLLAPAQFLVFLLSLGLVLRYLATGEGYAAANLSVVVKTLFLYAIMVTGCIWSGMFSGCYLFAPAFFWEDVVSMACSRFTPPICRACVGLLEPSGMMVLALAAYAAYVINAGQFLFKLRMARLEGSRDTLAGGAA